MSGRSDSFLGRALDRLDRLSFGRCAAGLALVMAAVQGIYLARAVRILDRAGAYGGSPSYGTLARNLLERGLYSLDGVRFTAYRPPLYPLFLAAHQWAFGTHWLAAAAVTQSAIALATGVLLLLFVRRVFDDRLAMIAAALLYLGDFFYWNEVLAQIETPLFVALVMGFFYLLARADRPRARLAGLGMLAGLAHLTRPTGGLLLPLLIPVLAREWRRGRWPAAAVGAALAGASFLAVALPWQLTLHRELGVATLLSSTTGGENVYKGNNPDLLTLCPYVWLDAYQPWIERELRARGTADDEVARDRALRAAAFDYIRGHPLAFLEGVAVKTLALHSPWPTPLGKAELVDRGGRAALSGYRRTDTFFVRVQVLHWIVVLSGVVLYLFTGLRRAPAAERRMLGLIAMFCLLFTATQAATISATRYRLPMDPLLIAVAAAAYARALHSWADRRARPASAPAAG